MTENCSKHVVADAMQPITELDVPSVLRESIERQSRTLMVLASNLLLSGMDEQEVKTIISQASASYRDELISAILALKGHYET